jgi:hypothetical protein
MKKVWTTKTRNPTATKSATAMMTPHSNTRRRVAERAACWGPLTDRTAGSGRLARRKALSPGSGRLACFGPEGLLKARR